MGPIPGADPGGGGGMRQPAHAPPHRGGHGSLLRVSGVRAGGAWERGAVVLNFNGVYVRVTNAACPGGEKSLAEPTAWVGLSAAGLLLLLLSLL